MLFEEFSAVDTLGHAKVCDYLALISAPELVLPVAITASMLISPYIT